MSELSFCRALGLDHRQPACAKASHTRSVTRLEMASNRGRLWDMIWPPRAFWGAYLYLCMILDIYEQKIVGHEGHATESADRASNVICRGDLWGSPPLLPVVLQGSNGDTRKGSATRWTLDILGISLSFSRCRVSTAALMPKPCSGLGAPIQVFLRAPLTPRRGCCRLYNGLTKTIGIVVCAL